MSYQVKEIYYTLQGEGARTGRAAVFLRFAGCNLWSGVEKDRARAVCTFCDTDFVGVDGINGGRFAKAADLAARVAALWPTRLEWKPYVVCTGGEPLLQLDCRLIDALHGEGFEIAIESNGTIEAPAGIDWICVSPKAEAEVVQRRGDELKLVYPQRDAPPERFSSWNFRHFFLQPMDSPARDANTRAATVYCLSHPQWRLSLQTHKLIGLP
ncbi:MAG TPA: 7-carboxy-7-deazaguanine synthase [Rhizomicrobium sp.]|jgi:7-carboxy-7-deazaguanine synthase (Cx14CxxC type)|nr:7-carboxy-7-deazaguanine synthase [Rhizomicrobium sp.]